MKDIRILQQRFNEQIDFWQPSGALSLFEKGEKIYNQYVGYQDIECNVESSADTTYVFSARSKSLISLCILQLADKGILSLDDYLNKYIPEYPHADKIKIENLLRENSGIPDYFSAVVTKELIQDEHYTSLPAEQQFINERKLYSAGTPFDVILSRLSSMPLEYQPGTREVDGSDADQEFLAEILRRVSKMSLFDYLEQNIFVPLGMNNTVEGHHGNGKSYLYFRDTNRISFEQQECTYAITTTLADLEKLGMAIYQGELLSKKYWKIASSVNKWNVSYCFFYRTGWLLFELYGIYGDTIIISIKRSRQLIFVTAYNDCGKEKMIGDTWHRFIGDSFSILDQITTYPLAPKVVPLHNKNVYETLKLSVTEEQKSFVWLPTIAIGCSSVRPYNKSFVLEDCGVIIGLLILEANKKEDYYYVSTVLIDEHYQRRGYGKIMVAWGVEWLKNKGAKELSIGVNRHNVAARALYTSLGFAPANVYDEGVYMKMKL